MTGSIIFNGTSSQNFGLIVEKVPSSVHASRRGNLISIPGRNGVIVREDGSFDTYTQEYDIWFSNQSEDDSRSVYDVARDVAEWLLGASGFCRLEDDFEPEHYRMARYSGALNVDMLLLQCGKAKLTFECQPQRYLKSGESAISIDSITDERRLVMMNVSPLSEDIKSVRYTVFVEDGENVHDSATMYIERTDGEYKYANFIKQIDPDDMDYTNVMDRSSSRYIAGSRYSMNSHAFVDSENPECDCVVVPVPQNNETTRIRIKNATFSNWNTVYGGTTNNAFNKDYGRNPVNPSAPQDEYGDYYFDFQNNGSSFITFNINPMSNPSSLIVTVNEPIVRDNADGLDEYVGGIEVTDGEIGGLLYVDADFNRTSFASVEFLDAVDYMDVSGDAISGINLNTDGCELRNFTNYESRPLIKVTGIPSSPPSPVTRTLTRRNGLYISDYGNILLVRDKQLLSVCSVSNPVSVSGYAYAYVTGGGYVFRDRNGKTRSGGFVPTSSGNLKNKRVIIPTWAYEICVATNRANQNASLQFLPAYTAGTAVATVNGTTINLDFSAHDTIYLDCDLHDAYYEDGSSANAAVSFSSTLTDYPTFPGLLPGDNTISVSSENTVSFEIVPRWWVL